MLRIPALIIAGVRLLGTTQSAQAYMFTRGQRVEQEDLYYACEEVGTCLDDPVPACDFDPNNLQLCLTHGKEMKYLVAEASKIERL